jgi:ligand-binding SRPBCC domain-containing protein
MPKIHLTTFIAAPVERVFDLCRSINLHSISTAGTDEKAIAGVTTGLINLNETVTWEAKHLFKTRRHTSVISAMEKPVQFVDEMTAGDFKSFRHQHHFKSIDNGTIMIDILEFESPYGNLGKFFNAVYLKKYLQKFLEKRNNTIKEYAETQKWKAILTPFNNG